MKINITGVVKGVAELAVSAGVGTVVGNLVRATTPYELTKYQKVMIGVGSYALTTVLGDLSAKHVAEQIDTVSEKIQKAFHKNDVIEVTEAEEEVLTLPEGQTADSVKDDIVKSIKKTQKKDAEPTDSE